MTFEEHEKELVKRIIYHKEQTERLQTELSDLRKSEESKHRHVEVGK